MTFDVNAVSAHNYYEFDDLAKFCSANVIEFNEFYDLWQI